jgi:hypothetical protein
VRRPGRLRTKKTREPEKMSVTRLIADKKDSGTKENVRNKADYGFQAEKEWIPTETKDVESD